jgi:hypothetical protein
MFELWINSKRVELSESSLFSLNFLFEDFVSLNERRAFYSRTIELPDTNKNRIILDNCLAPISQVSQFNKSNEFEVIRNGVPIMQGTQILARKSVRGGNRVFEINLFSFGSDLAERLANIRLHDIDLGKWTYTTANIVNSWNNNGLTGNYVVPLVNRFAYLETITPTTNINSITSALYPHIFVNKVLQIGLRSIGKVYKSKVLVNEYRDLVAHFNRVDIGQTAEFLAALKSGLYHNVFSTSSGSGSPVVVNNYSSGTGNPTYRSASNGSLIASSNGTHIFRLQGNLIGNVTTTTTHTYKLEIYNATTNETVYEFPEFIRLGGQQYFVNVNLQATLDLVIANVYQVRVTQTYSPSPSTVPVLSLSDFTYSFEPIKLLNTFNQEFKLAKYLPDISLLDFIKQVLVLINGYMYEENGTVYIESANDFFLPESQADDWTMITDHESMEISAVNDGYKSYKFGYKNNPDEAYIKLHKEQKNRNVGERIVNITTPQANASEFNVQVNGSATHDRVLIGGKNIPSIGVLENEDAGLRFLMYGGLTNGAFRMNNVNYTRYPMCYFNMAGKPSLDFASVEGATGLVDKFYKNRVAQIENGVRLKCGIKLSEKDILELSFRKPKIISFPDGNYAYFYLLSINDYNGSGITECEFIQIR